MESRWSHGSMCLCCFGLPFAYIRLCRNTAAEKERKEIASFQIANGGERRHVMCVGARSGSNPGPLGSEPSAFTDCASCPLIQRQTASA